jgi:hypothetical protein
MSNDLTAEEKIEEMRRHLKEQIEFCELQQTKGGVDHHFYFMRECFATDTLGYLAYLEGKESKDNEILFALLNSPKEMRDKYYNEREKKIRNDTLDDIINSIKYLDKLLLEEKRSLFKNLLCASFIRGARSSINGMIITIEQLKTENLK